MARSKEEILQDIKSLMNEGKPEGTYETYIFLESRISKLLDEIADYEADAQTLHALQVLNAHFGGIMTSLLMDRFSSFGNSNEDWRSWLQ